MNFPIILLQVAKQTEKTGLWASFVKLLGSILNGINNITSLVPEPWGGYGLAIIIFTIFMRLLLLPLDLKSKKSNMRIQEIQPELEKINKKYKNDPDKLNKKTMELYQKNNVNPMGGCLPLLLTLPITFAMFAALRELAASADNQGLASSFLWIKSIWSPDSPMRNIANESIPFFGEKFNGLFILPILAGVTSYFQMKIAQPKDAPQNEQMGCMTTAMPLMSLYFCTMYTASFAIYYVTSNIFQIVQTIVTQKTFSPKDVSKEGEE